MAFFTEKEKLIVVATLEEDARFSLGGGLAVLLLVFYQIVMIMVVSGTSNLISQAAAGTVWIAGNVILCTAMILGRKKTYRILRKDDSAGSQKPAS